MNAFATKVVSTLAKAEVAEFFMILLAVPMLCNLWGSKIFSNAVPFVDFRTERGVHLREEQVRFGRQRIEIRRHVANALIAHLHRNDTLHCIREGLGHSGCAGAKYGFSTVTTENSGCISKKEPMTPSFSSGAKVQVEYTSRPPGRTSRAAEWRISACRRAHISTVS